nr:hypothetical protein [Tanacetum cinerariifolium]
MICLAYVTGPAQMPRGPEVAKIEYQPLPATAIGGHRADEPKPEVAPAPAAPAAAPAQASNDGGVDFGKAAGLSREEIAFLINADLLVAGIATVHGRHGGDAGCGLAGHLRRNHRGRVLRHADRAVHVENRPLLSTAGHRHRHHVDRPVAVSRGGELGG